MAKPAVKHRWYRLLAALWVVAGLGLCAIPNAGLSGQPPAHRLLLEAPATALAREPALPSPHTQRIRRVTLNPIFNHPETITVGDHLALNLSEAVSLEARVDRVTTNAMGTVTVRARLDDRDFSHALITSTHGKSSVLINIPESETLFQIIPDSDAIEHRLLEIPSDQIDHLEPAAVAIPSFFPEVGGPDGLAAFDTGVIPDPQGVDDPATIAVMVVYTPAASLWAATRGGIANIIATAMANAQLVHDNSNTGVTFELVHSAVVDYIESGDSYTDLARLRGTRDGFMDEVHQWRDRFGADLVALFADNADFGGLGYLLASPNGNPAYGFSITRVRQAATGYTHVHEMGHNMGLHHHKEQNQWPGPGLFSYSAGWRWTGSDNRKYCSVMTYESGTYFADGIAHRRVPYFSDPHTNHLGTPTGDIVDGDNARTVREVKHVIAAYRTPPVLIPQAEREALIAWYEGTDGDHWSTNTGWKNPPLEMDGFGMRGTECSWSGVTCAGGNVTILDMNNKQLTGTIVPELSNLTHLEQLWLSNNQLTGDIPPELGSLTHLQILALNGNQLSGTIPSELGNLVGLTDLDLGTNQLTGAIPPQLGNLTHLQELTLYANHLTGAIPPEFGLLERLSMLDLQGNQLSGPIPPELGNLHHLDWLGLNDNQLTGAIPPELGNLLNLHGVFLHRNRLTGEIPAQLGNLNHLWHLDLHSNLLTGAIPPELGNLARLSHLDLGTNRLTGVIPPELGNLTDLDALRLNGNRLSGTIPPELGNLHHLSELLLNDNQLTGPIPSTLINLINLWSFDICNNYLYTDQDSWFFQRWAACQYALPDFSFTPPALSVPAAAGSSGIDVANSGGGSLHWTAAVIAGADWLSITSGSSGIDAGTVICTYHQNPAGARTGLIRFESLTGQQVDYPVNQAAVTHLLNTTTQPGGAGVVIRSPSQASYSHAAAVQLTANPALSYIFSHWSGDVGGPSNPITLSMDSAQNVTAHFLLKGHPHAISASVAGEALTVVTLTANEQDFVLNITDGTRTLPDHALVASVHFQNNTATLSYRDGTTRTVTIRHADGYTDEFINAVMLAEIPQHTQFTTLLNLPSFDVEGDFLGNQVVIRYPGIVPVSTGPDIPVKDLALLKLKPVGQPAIAFTYQDDGADGDFWMTDHLQDAALAPTDTLQAGQVVDLYLAVADNGEYDLDNTINVIVDPLVLGRLTETTVPSPPASDPVGGGSGGGCFIGTVK